MISNTNLSEMQSVQEQLHLQQQILNPAGWPVLLRNETHQHDFQTRHLKAIGVSGFFLIYNKCVLSNNTKLAKFFP